MNFLLLILRMVLGLISPAWRDSLLLAARADGRTEHRLQRSNLWKSWMRSRSREAGRRIDPALAVRAVGSNPPRGKERGA